jgi:hypothetical protein
MTAWDKKKYIKTLTSWAVFIHSVSDVSGDKKTAWDKNTQKHPHKGRYSSIQYQMFQGIKDITDTTKEEGVLE